MYDVVWYSDEDVNARTYDVCQGSISGSFTTRCVQLDVCSGVATSTLHASRQNNQPWPAGSEIPRCKINPC